jgi:hypothetical protein
MRDVDLLLEKGSQAWDTKNTREFTTIGTVRGGWPWNSMTALEIGARFRQYNVERCSSGGIFEGPVTTNSACSTRSNTLFYVNGGTRDLEFTQDPCGMRFPMVYMRLPAVQC